MRDETRPALVLDASVAIAIICREPAATAVRRVLLGTGGAMDRLLVPDGFWVELANVLVRRYATTSEETVEALREIDELGVESVRIDRALVLAAMDLQQRHGLSGYDAIYLSLAEAEDCRLVTLDARLADAAGDRAVRLDGMRPPRLAEEPAGYGSEPIGWVRFGPYLARLRAEAREEASAGRGASRP